MSAGAKLAGMTKPVITYWVRYREPVPGTYEVLATYYHRMRIEWES